MVDVNNKDNNNQVKDGIEKNISNAIATVSIEDTSSYAMYQGEIDEGKAYVGIFSGLFLFIALLSVITTMTRVVKNQKLQIGTLKALGFSKLKITMHYVSYGFWVSLVGAALGIILGKYFLGSVFLNLEMSFFEVPNGKVFTNPKTYLVALLVIIVISIITFMTSYKELKKKPADSLKNELPKIKNGSLNLTTKGIFKKLNFASKWNLRDIFRNKFINAFAELKQKLDNSHEIAAVKNIKLESDTLKLRCMDEITEYEEGHRPKPVQPVTPPTGSGHTEEPQKPVKPSVQPKPKKRKNVSISSVAGARTYSIENEQDIDKFLAEMKKKLLNELDENTIITLS